MTAARLDDPRRRRRRRRARWLVAVVVLGWALAVGFLLSGAVKDARAGERAVRDVREELSAAQALRGDGAGDLRAAASHFASAESKAGSPLLAPLRLLPVAGRQIRSLHALTSGGARALDAAADALEGAREALDVDVSSGPAKVELLEALRGLVEDAGDALEGIELGPTEGLAGPLFDARHTLQTELTEMQALVERARVTTAGLADFLKGPGRYLVLGTNNAEMQAGWGMPLVAGVLTVDAGSLSLPGMPSVGELRLPPEAVELEGDLAENWGFLVPDEDWRNLALTPRFERAGALAAEMYATRGQPVDGVLALDPFVLQAILAATGPVSVDGRTVSADDVIEFALHDQYVEQVAAGEFRSERQDRLSSIAVAAVTALGAGSLDAVALVEGLAEAARGRHLLAWSSDRRVQAAWVAADVDGALDASSLLVSLINRGGNKLDWFVDVEAELTAHPVVGGAEGRLAVTIANRTPEGEVPYVAGPFPGSGAEGPGDYIGFLAVNLPGAARSGAVEGIGTLVAAGPDGPTRLIAARVEVPRGETRTFVVTFDLPFSQEAIRVEPSGRARPVRWRIGDLTWADGRARTVRSVHDL